MNQATAKQHLKFKLVQLSNTEVHLSVACKKKRVFIQFMTVIQSSGRVKTKYNINVYQHYDYT